MKKIVLTMVALMSMTMTFAENETAANLNKAEAYNMKTVNVTKLCQALNLSKDQVEGFMEIHKTFTSELLFAAQMNDEERQLMVEKAIKKDLAWMDYILNKDQYQRHAPQSWFEIILIVLSKRIVWPSSQVGRWLFFYKKRRKSLCISSICRTFVAVYAI